MKIILEVVCILFVALISAFAFLFVWVDVLQWPQGSLLGLLAGSFGYAFAMALELLAVEKGWIE